MNQVMCRLPNDLMKKTGISNIGCFTVEKSIIYFKFLSNHLNLLIIIQIMFKIFFNNKLQKFRDEKTLCTY